MLLNSSWILIPAKALNLESLFFLCCSERGYPAPKWGSLFGIIRSIKKIVKGMTFSL